MKSSPRRVNKVLLIFPHIFELKGNIMNLPPPLGVAYLAAVLERNGYTVKILDLAAEDFNNREGIEDNLVMIGLSYKETEKRIIDFEPDMVGVSCLISSQYGDMLKLCELVKKIDKNIVTIVGGGHPSALPAQSLQCDNVDFVSIGESEYSLLSALQSLNSNRDVSHIDGFGYKQDGHIHINPKTKFIENIDTIPFPARHLLPMETYFKMNIPQCGTSLKSPNTSILTSRGCPARCIYCASSLFWGRKFRGRSPENVLQEMESLIQLYGVKELSIIDDNLTLDKERAMKLFQGMIDRRLNLVWNTPNGSAVWALDEELLSKMKEAGCYEVTLAVESGDQEVLTKIVKKPLRLSKVERLVAHAKGMGLLVKAFFMMGFPGETRAQMKKTIDFAKRLRFDAVGIFIATPLPGTELYRICKDSGYLKRDFAFEKMSFAIGSIRTSHFTPEQLVSMRSRAVLQLNMRLLLRNPFRFYKKYSNLMFTNPKEIFELIFFLIRKTLHRGHSL